MKKMLAIVLAALMLLPILNIVPFAADITGATELGLYCGNFDNGGFSCRSSVSVSKTGTYKLSYNFSQSSDYNWIILKNKAGENESTTIPAGYIIKTSYVKVNGTAINLGDSVKNYVVKDEGSTKGKVEIMYIFNLDAVQGSAKSVEIEFEVVDPNGTAVTISQANLGATKDCTISNGVATSTSGANQFSFKLPKTYSKGEEINVKIKYSSGDAFRVRLSTNDANVCGTDWITVDATSATTEKTLSFTALENNISEIYFKAKSYDATLNNLKVSAVYLDAANAPVTDGSIVDTPVVTGEKTVVAFNNSKGDNVGVGAPWEFFGVGDFWGYNQDLDISFADIKEMLVNGGATFSFVFSGSNPGTPKACFNFNVYNGSELNVPCTVTNLGNGKYEAKVELDSLSAAWKAIGKTLDDSEAAAFLIQPWTSDFKLYSAEFTVPVTSSQPSVEPTKPTEAPDVTLDGFMKDVEITTYCPDKYLTEQSGVTYGNIESLTYYSTTCGMDRPVNVVLPANYTPTKQYPVLYALHGIFCDENTLMNSNKTHIIIQNMIADGTAREMIIVFPNMYASTDPNQEPAFDLESVKPYDNFVNDLVNDLMPFIESKYSVAAGRDNTAVFGFSMGGRETLAIGFMHPEMFGYIGAVAPAPGLTPGADWAMTHPGMFKESELKFSSTKPYLLMLCAGDKDGTVGTFPLSYHKILNTNQTQHIWYEIPGSDHGDPAIASATYNFAKYAFKATAEPEPVEVPDIIFFSPHTGSDVTGDGTKNNPFKTEKKAIDYANRFGGNIPVLEFMMAVEVYTGNGFSVNAPTGSITMIPFTGKTDSYYFKGETIGTGYDTQKWGVKNSPNFSARYMLTGTDYTGAACNIFIENNGNALDNCTPTVFTDSAALAGWNTANLRAIVDVTGYGVLVQVYTIH